MKVHKSLSADGLIRLVRQGFGEIKDHRIMNIDIELSLVLAEFVAGSKKEIIAQGSNSL